MPGFKLQTPEGELIGFLMLEGKDSVDTGATPRDCIFMSVPGRAELAEHDLNQFLRENMTTAFRCTFSRTGSEWEASIPVSESVQVRISCTEGESGRWRVQNSNGAELWGRCHFL